MITLAFALGLIVGGMLIPAIAYLILICWVR